MREKHRQLTRHGPFALRMNRVKHSITTALAFAVGEALICVMLVIALVCKLTERIGKARPPH
ncbi:hypothetical protein P0D88_24240 [Paraburkholderia sp. RL18-103-BIB-C]|jgi:hypothetical protein|uniref:hypothetical protein n=1 Tax=unclassified Paraburkholderia TaxID=2615204 RepID=UPI0038BBF2D7